MSVQAKRCLDIRVAKKPLHRLDIRPLIHQPACQPVAEVVEAEPLPLLELHPGGNRCRTEIVPSQNAARSRRPPLVLALAKTQSLGRAYTVSLCQSRKELASRSVSGTGASESSVLRRSTIVPLPATALKLRCISGAELALAMLQATGDPPSARRIGLEMEELTTEQAIYSAVAGSGTIVERLRRRTPRLPYRSPICWPTLYGTGKGKRCTRGRAIGFSQRQKQGADA